MSNTKKLIIAIFVCLILTIVGVLCFKNNESAKVASAQDISKESYLRLHIRANSNSEADQNVKMKVKEKVVDFLVPIVASFDTLEEAHGAIKSHLKDIKQVADSVLLNEGFNYKAYPRLCDEYFPTRAYNEVVLNEGVYDALIIDLGSGSGNNWWCVVYPPLCFTMAENTTSNTITYKSRLYEIVNKFFG